MSAGDLGSGLACNDGAKGTGFIMYSVADVHSRFSSTAVHKTAAHHFVCVRYDQGWKYDTNGKWVSFTPADSDVLVASADFSLDMVTDLQGAGGMYQNVKHGYASGDLTITANKWQDMRYAKGEFHVAGKGFTPREDYATSNFNSAGDLGNGLACNDAAKGTGYIMYSEMDVHERFKATGKVHNDNAHHFVCVTYAGGEWKYDTNSKYIAFTPLSTDVLVAAADYGKDTVQDLKGNDGKEQNMAKGYASGDLTFTANKWDPMKYAAGEFHVGGTGFNPNQ
jgi:hypothetical protein